MVFQSSSEFKVDDADNKAHKECQRHTGQYQGQDEVAFFLFGRSHSAFPKVYTSLSNNFVSCVV